MSRELWGLLTTLRSAIPEPTPYRFRADHQSFLGLPANAGVASQQPGAVDAVILLNHRHPERLWFGSDLAASLGCPLLVMCTSQYLDDVVTAVGGRRRRPRHTYVLALPWPAEVPVEGLVTPDEVGARSPKHRDVSAKRNLGLGLARVLGWRRTLFLDDDIRKVTADAARLAAGTVSAPDHVRVVSWFLKSFPDNSVVCHARRLAGFDQQVFVGSGAMVIDVAAQLPIFPPVYNEDWLFLYDLIAGGGLCVAGEAHQLRFNPFGLPERAREEEFGDVLAEGLFHLLHEGAQVTVATNQRYWDQVLQDRRGMVQDLCEGLTARLHASGRVGPAHRRRIEQALQSVRAAAAEHLQGDLAPSLASFVRAWRADLGVWNDWFEKLEQVETITQALEPLGIRREWLTIV